MTTITILVIGKPHDHHHSAAVEHHLLSLAVLLRTPSLEVFFPFSENHHYSTFSLTTSGVDLVNLSDENTSRRLPRLSSFRALKVRLATCKNCRFCEEGAWEASAATLWWHVRQHVEKLEVPP
ncbi:hypothetical protein DVH24_010800 [Malus domestica]|uniref:Uncharacterized protein n=1 Tax=Malus domestica TaxID=3750 RepID=A0A498JTD4_MALDO|nr:hypothetical protein DVH24_010800 [Malus domestica]